MDTKEKIELLKKRLDLIVLPNELDKLEKGKKYSIQQIYKRLQALGSIEPWQTYETFLNCCKEYETMYLGFKVIDNQFLIVVPKKKYNPNTKSYE